MVEDGTGAYRTTMLISILRGREPRLVQPVAAEPARTRSSRNEQCPESPIAVGRWLPWVHGTGAHGLELLMVGRALVTGATGFVGGRLAAALVEAGWEVRGMVRDRSGARARQLEQTGVALHEADVLDPASLRGAGRGVDVAYYLIHSMGRGEGGDFAANERVAAASFARMARAEGVDRVVYLGGLGDRPESRHLRSRHETALVLAEHGPPL